ncbi:sialin isoform X2 [Phymastichus coffea]|uniref:sialin isoform X2 n=1 Tax=Phymastichus coffea TaxID=108790 RepID=UPI00273C8E11|nr:sialin isoform X2 [Phymastichus coffea]
MARFLRNNSISCRDVLWALVFWGFGVNYMLRNNLNLAIVTMIVPHDKSAAASECAPEASLGNRSVVVPLNSPNNPSNGEKVWTDRYHWNEYQQGLALGAYYWFHWLSQLPGGLMARNLNALIITRALQGLISGVIWPSMHDMTAKWIPPNERSRFISSYLGSSVGVAVTYPLCAVIIDAFGWEAVFHITSVIGILWYVFWLFLVYDTPQQHPRITAEEKSYIVKSLAASRDDECGKSNKKVPWRSILTSGPFWVTIIAHWGGVWGFITFMTQAPSYFNYVQGWNINTVGLLSGSPHIARMIFSYMFSMLSDWLLRTKRMPLTAVRKFANFVCTGGQCLLTIGLGFSGCRPGYAAFFMISGTAINGAVSSGSIPAFVDLSPNYASVLFGICNLVTLPAGFISPLVVGILTNENQTIKQWRLVFLISAANLAVSCIVHLIWGTSAEQPWNNHEKETNEKDVEERPEAGELIAIHESKTQESEDDKS